MANLFGNATPANNNQNAGAPGITTGTRLRFASAGTITAVRWYCPTTAPAAASWIVVAYVAASDSAGSGLGSGSFSSLTPGAWNTASCSIAVNAGDEIVVEVWNSEGRYVNTPNYFASDVVVGNITGPADDNATPRHNGRFNVGGSITFPTDGFSANGYFVDVEFTASGTTLTQTDTAGLTDTATLNRTSVATDTAGLTDTTTVARTSVLTDLAGLTDSAALTVAPVVTDTVGLTDGVLLGRTLVATDTIGLTDGLAATAQAHTITDAAGLSDNATVQGGTQAPPAEWAAKRPHTAWAAGNTRTAWAADQPRTAWHASNPRGG